MTEQKPDPNVGDLIAFDAYHDGHERHEVDEPVSGVVLLIGGDTFRVRGIGNVDVNRDDIVEIVERADS